MVTTPSMSAATVHPVASHLLAAAVVWPTQTGMHSGPGYHTACMQLQGPCQACTGALMPVDMLTGTRRPAVVCTGSLRPAVVCTGSLRPAVVCTSAPVCEPLWGQHDHDQHVLVLLVGDGLVLVMDLVQALHGTAGSSVARWHSAGGGTAALCSLARKVCWLCARDNLSDRKAWIFLFILIHAFHEHF
jgi:hypothetical protein